MIYTFTTITLKFSNSKTLRLAQLLSEKPADGVIANKRKWSREKNPCKQVSKWHKEHRASAYFCYGEVIHILKWQRVAVGMFSSSNSFHQSSWYRSVQKLATKQQRITGNLQLSYGMAWRKQSATKEKNFSSGKNYAIHPYLEGGLFGLCCCSCWGEWVGKKVS